MDLNEDGHGDLLSGSYSRMEQSMAGLFQVLWGQADGTFKTAAVLKGTDDEPLIIPIEDRSQQTENICTRPTAVDWDGDGDLDLVVGNFAGSFYLFKGKGEGQFLPDPEAITVGDAPLKIDGAHSDPFVIDWDADGDMDLVSGSSNGGVQWAQNVAGAGKAPILEAFKPLIESGSRVPYGQAVSEDELVGPAGSTRVWVDDVNSDGKLDVLVGDTITLVSPAEGISQEDLKKKYAEWQAAINEAMKDLRSATADAEERKAANDRYRDLHSERGKFMSEERTGFVWVYLQK